MSIEISRKRGDTKPIVFKLWQDKSSGTLYDTTGCSFKFTVDPEKYPVDATNNILSLTGTDIGESRIKFSLSALQANITPGTYYFDLQVTDALGIISTPEDGKFKIIQDITK